jgi:replicative DNA helicase
MNTNKNDGKSGDRLPPHSIEAEQGVLGCALLEPAGVLERLATERWTGNEFYDLRHREIFQVLMTLFRAGQTVDLIAVQQKLKDAELLEQSGGIAYLNELMDSVPSASNVGYYTTVVKSKAMLRQVLALCGATAARVYDFAEDPSRLVDEVSNSFLALSENTTTDGIRHIRDVMVGEVLPDLEEHYSRGKTNLPPGNISTGFEYLDKVGGGIAIEDYMVVAGRPGAGKTALAMNIAEFHALNGLPVGVFSLEMSRKALGKRLMFKGAQVSMQTFRQGFATNGDVEKLNTAGIKLCECPIYIDSEPSQTIGQIEAKARMMARQYGIKLFVLDYLQLILPDKRAGRIDRVQELTDISARFVALKKALKIPWLILAQMNRNIEQAESHRVPVMSDLKDCGAIEQDADQILFLYFPERSKKEGDERDRENQLIGDAYEGKDHTETPQRVNLFQAKHRDGATGPVKMLFHKNQSRFEDWRRWELEHGGADYGKGERERRQPAAGDYERGVITDDDIPQ